MNALILYVKNVAIAFARIVKATFGLYQYSPDDGWFQNWWVCVDCFVNALCLGDPDETISSRSAKADIYEVSKARYGWGCRMCSFLAIFQKDHCGKALEKNKGSRALNSDAGAK